MKIDRQTLNIALREMNRLVDPRSKTPLLECVFIVADGQHCHLVGVDDEEHYMRLDVEIDLAHKAAPLAIAVNCADLRRILADENGRGELIEFVLNESGSKPGRLEIRGENFTIEMDCVELVDDNNVAGLGLDWEPVQLFSSYELKNLLAFVLPAVAQYSNPNADPKLDMGCVRFLDGIAEGTDGHRLHKMTYGKPGPHEPFRLPLNALGFVEWLVGPFASYQLLMSTDRTHARVIAKASTTEPAPEFTFTTALSTGDFPTLAPSMLPEYTTELVLNVHDFEWSLEKAAQATGDRPGPVVLTYDPQQKVVEVESFDGYNAIGFKSNVPCETVKTGLADNQTMSVHVSAKYLLDAVSHFTDSFRLQLAGPLAPIIVQCNDRAAVIMPRKP